MKAKKTNSAMTKAKTMTTKSKSPKMVATKSAAPKAKIATKAMGTTPFADITKLDKDSFLFLNELLGQNSTDKQIKTLSAAVKGNKLAAKDFSVLGTFLDEVNESIEEDLMLIQAAHKNLKALKQNLKTTQI